MLAHRRPSSLGDRWVRQSWSRSEGSTTGDGEPATGRSSRRSFARSRRALQSRTARASSSLSLGGCGGISSSKANRTKLLRGDSRFETGRSGYERRAPGFSWARLIIASAHDLDRGHGPVALRPSRFRGRRSDVSDAYAFDDRGKLLGVRRCVLRLGQMDVHIHIFFRGARD